MSDFRILVVDDDVATLAVVSEILQMEGYRATVAVSGAEAVRLALDTQPDLILLDWLLPDVRGEDVLTALRARAVETPIVAMTALGDAAYWSTQTTVNGYLAKPFDLDDLVRTVERFCPNRRSHLLA